MEKSIFFNSGHLRLEGLYRHISDKRGVVVAHPHPLHGGDMMNNVVEALCLAYNECDYSSLRFNFRGVGQSEGSYDNGDGEEKDLEAAIQYLTGIGVEEVDLAGYSFGSWIIARGVKTFGKIGRIIMVSPPVDLFDYSLLYNTRETRLIIAGSEDNIADWRSIEKIMSLWNPDATLEVINGADHFYWEKTDDIREIVRDFIFKK